jgi:predicted DNA-binding ribbon-helix-helix protein
MKSSVVKRSIIIDDLRTSVSIEDIFWDSFKAIAKENGMTLSGLIASIKADRLDGSNLSSAIRVYVLTKVRAQAEALRRAVQGASGQAAPITAAAGSAGARPALGQWR